MRLEGTVVDTDERSYVRVIPSSNKNEDALAATIKAAGDITLINVNLGYTYKIKVRDCLVTTPSLLITGEITILTVG